MSNIRTLCLASILCAVPLACSSPPSNCTPGQTISCPCLGGGGGVQSCDSDGKGYGTCLCAAGGSSSSGSTTGTSSGSSSGSTSGTTGNGSTSGGAQGNVQLFEVSLQSGSVPTGTDCAGVTTGIGTSTGIDGGTWAVYTAPNNTYLLEGTVPGALLSGTLSGDLYTFASSVIVDDQGTTGETIFTLKTTVTLTLTATGATGSMTEEEVCTSSNGASCGSAEISALCAAAGGHCGTNPGSADSADLDCVSEAPFGATQLAATGTNPGPCTGNCTFEVAIGSTSAPTGTNCPALANPSETDTGLYAAATFAASAGASGAYLLNVDIGTTTEDGISGTFANGAYTFMTTTTNDQTGPPAVDTTSKSTIVCTLTGSGFTGMQTTENICTSSDGTSCASENGMDYDCISQTPLIGVQVPSGG